MMPPFLKIDLARDRRLEVPAPEALVSMNFDQRVAFVERLSSSAIASPRAYALRVICWILLGYLILGGLFALALTLGAGMVAVLVSTKALALWPLAWIPLTVAWLLARVLLVRHEPVGGRRVHVSEAPSLFALVNQVRRQLRVPRLDEVVLVADLNAAVVETPRLGGIFGWRRTLMIGLPLLLMLSTEELKAVLAHEMGHLSARHGRIGAWTWRVRASWSRLFDAMTMRTDVIARQVRRLVIWYMDRMMAITLVQARSQEFAADRSSVDITSPAIAAAALARSAAGGAVLETHLWEPIWDRARSEPVPSASPMEELLTRRREVSEAAFPAALDKELARPTQHDDTHPALADRFAAIGVPAPDLAIPEKCAGEDLVPSQIRRWIGEFDRVWRQSVLDSWEERHAALKGAAERRIELSALPLEELTDEEVAELAGTIELLEKPEIAAPIIAPIVEARMEAPGVAYMYGSALLRSGDAAGIRYLSQAMERDWRAVIPAIELVYPFLRERGMHREAEEWTARYEQQCEIIDRARLETAALQVTDALDPWSPSEEAAGLIQLALDDASWVGRAWLVRKRLSSVEHTISCLVVRSRFGRFVGSTALQQLADSLPEGERMMVFYASEGSLIRKLDSLGARLR